MPNVCRAGEKREPGMSRQHTGISITAAPCRRQRASSSTSKANPGVRSSAAMSRASTPSKNLKPHWVSLTPCTSTPASARKPKAPSSRTLLCRFSTSEPSCPLDPITTRSPDSSSPSATSTAPRSVAMSASRKPTKGALVPSSPARTAAPLPGVAHRISRTGTVPLGQVSTISAVRSVLSLSTTMTELGNGMRASFAHSCRSPPGSRPSSL